MVSDPGSTEKWMGSVCAGKVVGRRGLLQSPCPLMPATRIVLLFSPVRSSPPDSRARGAPIRRGCRVGPRQTDSSLHPSAFLTGLSPKPPWNMLATGAEREASHGGKHPREGLCGG